MCKKDKKCLGHIIKKLEIALQATRIIVELGIATEKEAIEQLQIEINATQVGLDKLKE